MLDWRKAAEAQLRDAAIGMVATDPRNPLIRRCGSHRIAAQIDVMAPALHGRLPSAMPR
jgi:hypothetical protein